MKKIIALILAVTMLCSITAFAHPFNDVTGHWSEAEIEEAYRLFENKEDGVIKVAVC